MTARHHEIAFVHIMEHLGKMIVKEKLPMFIEMFAITFDVDFTNLSILVNQYLPKIKPSIKEVALMARDLGITVRRFPIGENYGYRLIRENRDEVLSPRILNESLAATLVDFNQKYIKISEQHPPYLKEVYHEVI